MKEEKTKKNTQTGDAIKSIIERYNVTRSDLADLLGISVSAVGMYCQGTRVPDYITAAKIADRFKLPLEAVYGLGDQNTVQALTCVTQRQEMADLVIALDRLNTTDIKRITEIAKILHEIK